MKPTRKTKTHHAPALISVTACGLNTIDCGLEQNGRSWDWTDGWRMVNCKPCLKKKPKAGRRLG